MRKRGKRGLLILLNFGITILFVACATAETPSLPAELALFTRDELAITATRTERPISESPSAITVITREEILRSGATHIPELLRRVAGVDVATISPGHSEVNIRGLNTALSSRTLVLVDGRTVFVNGQGFTPWESIPVVAEDIERIEVVKGPVEALYGSPALSGVINIITQKPGAVKETAADTSLGTHGTLRQTLRHYDIINDKLAYRISAELSQVENFEPVATQSNYLDHDGLRRAVVNSVASYKINDNSQFLASGGINNGEFILLTNPATGLGPMVHHTSFVKVDYSAEDPGKDSSFLLQGFWNRQKFIVTTSMLDENAVINTFDLNGHHAFHLGSRHSFLWGAGARYEEMDANLFNPTKSEMKSQLSYDLFLQDEIKLSELLTFYGTIRLDRHPITDYNIAYRTSLLYKPFAEHVFWLTTGRTFRNPTFTESDLDLLYNPGIQTHALGSEVLKPEIMNSYELGYRGIFLKRIKPEASVFVNTLKDYIFSQGPQTIPVITTKMQNRGRVNIYGTELGTSFLITSWLRAFANHSWLHVERAKGVSREDGTPSHKGNLGASFTIDKNPHNFMLDIFTTFVGSFEVPSGAGDEGELSSGQPGGKVGTYTLTNLRLGYKYKDWADMSLYVFNLFKDKHYEFRGAQDLGTRVVTKATIKF